MTTFAFHHVGLSVGNLDAQRHFYRDTFGLTPEQQAEIPRAGVRMAILRGPGGLRLELIERSDSTEHSFADVYDGASVQGYFHFAVHVADLDTAYEAVLAAGATSVSAPATRDDAARAPLRLCQRSRRQPHRAPRRDRRDARRLELTRAEPGPVGYRPPAAGCGRRLGLSTGACSVR